MQFRPVDRGRWNCFRNVSLEEERNVPLRVLIRLEQRLLPAGELGSQMKGVIRFALPSCADKSGKGLRFGDSGWGSSLDLPCAPDDDLVFIDLGIVRDRKGEFPGAGQLLQVGNANPLRRVGKNGENACAVAGVAHFFYDSRIHPSPLDRLVGMERFFLLHRDGGPHPAFHFKAVGGNPGSWGQFQLEFAFLVSPGSIGVGDVVGDLGKEADTLDSNDELLDREMLSRVPLLDGKGRQCRIETLGNDREGSEQGDRERAPRDLSHFFSSSSGRPSPTWRMSVFTKTRTFLSGSLRKVFSLKGLWTPMRAYSPSIMVS